MPHTAHELAEEFPADVAKIHDLKANNAHFAKLAEDYHRVNQQVCRAETRVDVLSGEHESELRHKRAHLKDEIARILRAV